jgi:hypothetical protein
MRSLSNSPTRNDLIIACALAALASFLVFPHLGTQALWQDEGQTAVVAQNVLRTGLPLASDGKNLVSIFSDRRDIRDGIYIWQPFAPVYAAAASMAIAGQNAAGARLPFALAFVLLVGLTYWIVLYWGDNRQAALVTATLMAGSVVLLLHARQCRYYVLAPLLNLLIVHAYLLLRVKPRLTVLVWLVIWSTLLINSFFPGALTLALGIAIDCLIRKPGMKTWTQLCIAAAIVALINLPMAIFLRIWSRPFGVQPGYSSFEVFFLYLVRYLLTINLYFFPLVLFIAAAVIVMRKSRTPMRRENGMAVCFCVICLSQLLGFSLISDYPFTRYMIGLAPFLFYLGAISIQRITAGRALILWPLSIVLICTNWAGVLLTFPARDFVEDVQWTTAGIDGRFLRPGQVGVSYAKGEIATIIREGFGSPLLNYGRSIVHPPQGPIDAVLDVLNKEARPSDVVKIAYEDLSLMFHTDLKIVSASTVGPAAPDWIIQRHLAKLRVDPDFVSETKRFQYAEKTLQVPDVEWNNQPDPIYHFYQELPAGIAPGLRMFKKPRADK